MYTSFRRTVFHLVLILILLTGALAYRPISATASPLGAPITIVPDQMIFSGPVITQANVAGTCTADWMKEMPAGGIILGANPGPCDTSSWIGATATLTVDLPAPANPTIYAMRISWPDANGKGLHSPRWNRTTSITLDGRTLWTMRTLQQSTYNDYYAVEHNPAIITLVVRQPAVHTLKIQVPAQTAWDIGKIEFIPYPYPSQIHGIGYSPYRDCEYPGGPAPSLQEVDEDLFRIANTNNAIRTYSSTGVNRQIANMAKSYGLKVFAGAWLDNLPGDESEIQGLLNIVNVDHVAVDGLIVGNEFYLRNRTAQDIDKLLAAILRVKNGLPAGSNIPVTTAEIDNLMFNWKSDSSTETPVINPDYKKIIDNVDIVMVHIYPFWSNLPIDGAAKFVVDRYIAMQARLNKDYPGKNKHLVIGETGWPSSGSKTSADSKAIPSLENQLRYLTEFLYYANRAGVDYLYFDGMDENWKVQKEGSVGPHWGYSYTDRTAKHAFYGILVSPDLILDRTIFLPLIMRSSLINGTLPLISQLATYIPGISPLIERLESRSADIRVNVTTQPNWVYADWSMGPEGSPFIPSTSGDAVSLFACDRSDPAQGEMSIRQTFTPSDTIEWGSANFLYPEKNAGDKPEGMNFQGMYNKLTFQARGAAGGERIEFYVGGIGTQSTLYPDSIRPAASTGYVELTTSWKTYTIDLRGKDLSHIINGFGWSTTKCANPQGATFYLDDIRFDYDSNLPPIVRPPTFPVYTDAGAPGNHYYPTNWMGDAAIPGAISFSECWTDNPYSGKTAIRISYPSKLSSPGWAGIYWTHPQENWADRPGGYDLTGVKRLTFWARSDTPGAAVKFIIGGVGYGNDGTNCSSKLYNYPDSVCPKIEYPIQLTSAWTKYTIPLTVVSPPRYFDRLVGGFGWTSNTPVTLYLDDIIYEFQ